MCHPDPKARDPCLNAFPGRLLIFPAWLRHSVPANDGQTDRISISFNLMFKQFAETLAAPMWDPTAGKVKD